MNARVRQRPGTTPDPGGIQVWQPPEEGGAFLGKMVRQDTGGFTVYLPCDHTVRHQGASVKPVARSYTYITRAADQFEAMRSLRERAPAPADPADSPKGASKRKKASGRRTRRS